MNLYLDASALIKRYLMEDGSDAVESSMREADELIASRIAFVETLGAVSGDSGDRAKAARNDWDAFSIIEVDHPLCERAVVMARRHGLTGLDAIHLASALAVSTDDLTFATWDRRLHDAAAAEGLETLPASLA